MISRTIDGVHTLMHKPVNIRNVSVISQNNEEETALINVLVVTTAITVTDVERSGEPAFGIQSPTIPLQFEVAPELMRSIQQGTEGSEFLVNLVTSTKQTSLLAQASASLRVTDGVIILIDVIEGIRIQTEAVLRRALAERVKPLFIIIGIAQAVLDPQVKKEDLYQAFRRMVEDVNLIVSTYCGDDLSDWRACPEGGAVVFASGRHGWAFTLRTFAHTYAEGFGLDPETMMSHLWGEHFYDPRTKTWSTKPVDSEDMPLERAFNTLVLDPIYKIYSAVASSQKDQLSTVLEDLKIDLPLEEMCLEGDAPFKAAMHRFLPADKNLLETIVIHLPSPVSAQQYRVGALYEGPMDDESAVGIRTCDPNGPLVVCISKMMPIRNSDDGRFYAFGRVFSGTIKAGMHVRIQGPDYAPSTKKDVFTTTIAHHAMLMISSDVQPLEDCPAGNIIALAGIDQFLLKSGTLSSLETTHNMTPANSSTTPVVQCSVEVTDAVDLPKLVEGLKRLSRSEACVRTQVLESGAYVIAAVDEPDLEFCVVSLREHCSGILLSISDRFVPYRETIRAESSSVALSKSTNRFNRLWAKAHPLGQELTEAIETRKVKSDHDHFLRADLLANKYSWDAASARKIWCFGPDTTGPNLLVDATKGVSDLHEIKDACVVGFQWATKECVCMEEEMRGVRLNILNVGLFSDAIHRGSGQIIPAMRRVCYAAYLLADPGIQEPVYLVEICCPRQALECVHACLRSRHGLVFSEEFRGGTSMIAVKAHLPVANSFGFDADLSSATGGMAFSQTVFDHWQLMDGSPLDVGSHLANTVECIRTRKGLEPKIPSLDRYLDKL